MKAIFIDCYVQNDDVILWLKQGKENIKVIDRFIPDIYVKGGNLKSLQKRLRGYGIVSCFTKRKIFYNNEEVTVLKIPVYRLSLYREMIRLIENLQNFAIELYNADMKLEEEYMFQKNLFPTALVECQVRQGKLQHIQALEEAEDIEYAIPQFEIAQLTVKTSDHLFKTFDAKIVSIEYNEEKIHGGEKIMLENFKQKFESQDPDIIWIENGNLILPYLKEQFRKHHIDFSFNRFERDDFEYKKGNSYLAYSVVFYRSASIFLKGRLHFDTRSFFADDTGFYGIIDGSRICRQRIQRTEMRSAGAAVTNLLLHESYKRKFLLPYRIGMFERFKTLGQLYEADRGSIVFEPKIGFHTDVVEFDYISLYPQIIWKHNLSPETLFCKCCTKNKVPGLQYHYCKKKRGIVSIVAEKLIARRMFLKKQGTAESREKAKYLKWLLVTMFGYQAFKNRKIGAIEIHESIQAYAREIILETVRVAEYLGWEVVHGIVDSVYVKKKGCTQQDIEVLGNEISKATNFKLSLEGKYRWIVFLPSIVTPVNPVSNHFYGIFEDGELKCRGIEARRKDSPHIIADMQIKMIEVLAEAKTEMQFKEKFSSVFGILKKYIEALHYTTPDDLKITRRLSKLEYINNIPQKILIRKMKEHGWDIQPGQAIAYIIRDAKNRDPMKRYVSRDAFDGKFDHKKYAELMVRATFNILQPFGITEHEIVEQLKKTRQLKLTDKKIISWVPEKQDKSHGIVPGSS